MVTLPQSHTILVRHAIIMLSIIAAVAAGAGYYVMERALDPGTPMSVTAVKTLTPVVKPGAEVEFMFSMNRNRRCPALIIGFMVDPSTNEAVLRFDPTFGGYGAIGSGVGTLVRRPAPNREGRFCYRATFTHWCGDKTYTDDEPEACFEVRQ